ncbi:hypothetical protein D4739_00220 [Nocardioides cavernaquae]|uniref:Uncharacterized protein n=2 Tax=Nocardioides cavernaquae TaxID=2321396 RepID=A0A3A5H4L5_9ACTN|nr:hypothetical protein D4739_00220 [Nocardioides cavernaquae]
MLEARPWSRRFAPAAALAVAAMVIAAIVFAVSAARQSSQDPVGSANPVVTLSPPEAVRGAQVEVTVVGLDDFSGAEVDLTVATVDASSEQGVGSDRIQIDDGGRLSTTITVPNSLGHETQVAPGEYRLVFGVKGTQRLRFDHPVHVVAAQIGETYVYVPTYGCLDYTRFDGRLWKLDGGDVKVPIPGSTFALASRDRATYTAPDGGTATFRVADPEAFDPETFSCPGADDSSVYAPPVRTTTTLGAPTELPAIASLKDSWMYDNGVVHHEYRLAGPANADTATPEALAANPRSLAVHPATYLTVDFNPGVGKFEVPADPAFSNIETVDVHGVMGQLTTMKNGLGVIRLDWVDVAGNYRTVMVDRLKTSDGLSGLSAQQILAVGRSVM